jgi:hypothetical protein
VHLPKILLLAITVACASSEGDEEAAAASATVTLDEFRQLQWIAGSWRGSGGAYPAFYEEYRVIDDSTIQMRSFPDSTFSAATDSSMIEFRGGAVQSRSERRTYSAIALAADSVRFAPPGVASGGHTFTRKSADEWTATLHPSSRDGQPTVYVMQRVQRAP